ncbi:MAG TPA: hypothetical protein V6D13_18465 [Halomicronema sp.]
MAISGRHKENIHRPPHYHSPALPTSTDFISLPTTTNLTGTINFISLSATINTRNLTGITDFNGILAFAHSTDE